MKTLILNNEQVKTLELALQEYFIFCRGKKNIKYYEDEMKHIDDVNKLLK